MASKYKRNKPAQSPTKDAVSLKERFMQYPTLYTSLFLFLIVWAGPRFGFIGAFIVGLLCFVGIQVWRVYRWRETRLVLLAELGKTDPGWWQMFVDYKTEYRLLQKTRTQFAVACRTAKIQGEAGNKKTPYLRDLKTTGNMDVTAEVVTAGGNGVTINQLVENAHDIAEICDAAELAIRRTKSVGKANLTFYKTDPIGRVIGLEDVPPSPVGTLAYGVRLDGGPAWIWQHESVFIGGLTRMGKSVIVRDLIADAIKKNVPIDLFIGDPKKIQMAEYAKQVGEDRAGCVKVIAYETEPDRIERMFDTMVAAKDARAQYLIDNLLDQHQPTLEEPLMLAIIDESLSLKKMLAKGAASGLGNIAFTGAASGCAVWLLSQLGDKNNMGDIRDLIPQSICLAVRSWQQMETVLGSGAKDVGAACHEIGDVPGVGWSSSSSQSRCEKFRAANVTRKQSLNLAIGKIDSKIIAKAENHQAFVYRARTFPDATGGRRLLYIGKSAAVYEDKDGNQHAPRFQQHVDNAKKPWWQEPGHPDNRVDWDDLWENIVWYSSDEEALIQEEIAIKTERPLYNKIHNGANADRLDSEIVLDDFAVEALSKRELKARKAREDAARKVIEMRRKARAQKEKRELKLQNKKNKAAAHNTVEQQASDIVIEGEVIDVEPTNVQLAIESKPAKITWPPIKRIARPSKPAAPQIPEVINGHASAPESWYSE